MDRRNFIAAMPAIGFLGSRPRGLPVGGQGLVLGQSQVIEEIGVQLYTLRSLLSEDVDGTLALVAEIGYRTVEFAGLYGFTPREMRGKLDAAGLRAVSSHAGVNEIRGDWPFFLEAGEMARSAGLRFGYHNHDWEFAALSDGTIMMDVLLECTERRLVDWQMDIFWTVHGGGDPMVYLEREAGRVTSVHLKDRTSDGLMVDVGKGVIDFATILPRAEELGMLHAFVEHDTPDAPLESVRYSFNALSALEL